MAEKEFSTQYLEYRFSEDERKEIAKGMARKVSEIAQLEDRKKAVTSQIKSEIDKKQAEVNLDANHLNTGFMMKAVKCEVERDYTARVIRYIRTDNGEVGLTQPMTAEDLQRKITH